MAVALSPASTTAASRLAKHGGSAESGEHDGEGESDGDGEESGTQFGLNDTFDEVRAGARLKLSYDSAANSFTGDRGEHHRSHAAAG